MTRSIRGIVWLLLSGIVLGLSAGCGDKEPEQRAAFIAFLENRVLNAPTIGLAELSRPEKKAFGDYAKHYGVLLEFQQSLSRQVGKNGRAMEDLARFESLEAQAASRKSLVGAAREANKLLEVVEALREKTEARRRALKQPDDLAEAYSRAYDRIVVRPSAAARDFYDAASAMFTAYDRLLALIGDNSRDIEIRGNDINLKNPALAEDLAAHMADAVREQQALERAYRGMIEAQVDHPLAGSP